MDAGVAIGGGNCIPKSGNAKGRLVPVVPVFDGPGVALLSGPGILITRTALGLITLSPWRVMTGAAGGVLIGFSTIRTVGEVDPCSFEVLVSS
jgi:hypothetical protein